MEPCLNTLGCFGGGSCAGAGTGTGCPSSSSSQYDSNIWTALFCLVNMGRNRRTCSSVDGGGSSSSLGEGAIGRSSLPGEMRLLLASSSESLCRNQELTETGSEWSKSLRLSDRLPCGCCGCWPAEDETPAAREEEDDRLGSMGLMLDEDPMAVCSTRGAESVPKKRDESPLPPPKDGGLLRLMRCSPVCAPGVVPVAAPRPPPPSSSESK